MHTLRYVATLGAILVLVACGTPTSSTTTGSNTEAATEATSAVVSEPTPAADGAGSTTGGKQYSAAPAMTIDAAKTYTAVITTNKGTMRAELYASEAPMTVNNFVFLARDGYYTNVKFHRIIKGFMVQTGDPQGDGTGGPGYQFEDEPVTREYTRGTLAMANAGPNTNGSQFFIVDADLDETQLAKDYTIFGKLTEGLDVLDAIADVPVAANPMNPSEVSVPQEEVLINSVSIEE